MVDREGQVRVGLKDLSSIVASNLGISRVKGEAVTRAVIDAMVGEVAAGRAVVISNFASFTPYTRAPFKAHDPRRREMVEVPERECIRMHPSPQFVKMVRGERRPGITKRASRIPFKPKDANKSSKS